MPSNVPVSVFLSRGDEIVDCRLVERGIRAQREMGEIGDHVKVLELEGGHAKMIVEPGTWRAVRAELRAAKKRP